MSEVATYVYCLLRSARAPSLRGVPAGLPRCGRPRIVGGGEQLWLVAADAPMAQYSEAALERGLRHLEWVSRCAMAHEAVIEHLGRAPALLPLKLFTLFASDARAAAFVEGQRKKLDRLLDRVEGRREWSVRLSVDPARVAALVEADSGSSRASSGAAFLAQKRHLRYAGAHLVEQGRAQADDLFKTLGHLAADGQRRSENETEPGSRLLLDAVYLVPMDRRVRFAATAKRASQALAKRGLRLELTGPWPPYHFAA